MLGFAKKNGFTKRSLGMLQAHGAKQNFKLKVSKLRLKHRPLLSKSRKNILWQLNFIRYIYFALVDSEINNLTDISYVIFSIASFSDCNRTRITAHFDSSMLRCENSVMLNKFSVCSASNLRTSNMHLVLLDNIIAKYFSISAQQKFCE